MNAQTKPAEAMPLETTGLVELLVIKPEDAMRVFTEPNAIEPYLKIVRARIDAFRGDASTPGGRKKIRSMAYEVARSKTALDDAGAALNKQLKELPKKIDAARKRVCDKLDEWRDEVRKPADDWDAAEDARIKHHADALDALKATAAAPAGTADQIRAQIAEMEAVSDGADREEFADGFRLAKAAALKSMREKLEWRETYDAEQAELARLRAEQAKRDAEDAERKRAEAEIERKRAEAKRIADGIEQAAAIAKENAARAAREAVEAAERAAREATEAAERRAQAERDAAERREAGLKEQAQAAERRAAEADARAKAEIERQQAEDRRQAEARERDVAHRGTVNRAALVALMAGGVPEEHAKQALVLIARGAVPCVKITY